MADEVTETFAEQALREFCEEQAGEGLTAFRAAVASGYFPYYVATGPEPKGLERK